MYVLWFEYRFLLFHQAIETSSTDSEKGIILIGYLENTKIANDLLEPLGFLINFNESVFQPIQSCKFLGFVFKSCQMTLEVPSE